jgi:hypothetical protein
MNTAEYKRELLRAIEARVDAIFDTMESSGRDAETLGDVSIVADRLVASIPKVSAINTELGPFYTTASLSKWLGVKRQYVHILVRQNRVASLNTADGHRIYPSFQFGTKGALLPHMPELLKILEENLEKPTRIIWLVTPQLELGGATPAEWLRAECPFETVRALAANYSAGLQKRPEV